jgi:hypothetical protein
MQRVLFNPKSSHSKDYKEFSLNYTTAILEVFDRLIKALTETYDIYRPLFIESYNEENPFTTPSMNTKLGNLLNFLNDADASLNSYLGVQYVYDLFQDLILAYNEFKNAAFDLMSECSADMTRFPKHLMLGEAIPLPLALCQNSEYRHYFVQPPIYNLQKLLIKRTISLHNRMVLMLESFSIKRINSKNIVELKNFPIRITPSLEKTTALSLRSIPWYYDLKKKSSFAALGSIKNYWNFDIARKCADEKEGLILNYEGQLPDQSVAKFKLETPLFYDIQDYSFLRIEGQTGVNVNLAVKKLKTLKAQFDLPFDLIALQLDPNLGSVSIDYNCGFNDIQEEFEMLKLNFCKFATDISELHKFIDENQDTLFDNENEEVDPVKIIEKIKEIVALMKEICDSMNVCFTKFNFNDFQKRYKTLLEKSIEIILIDFELLQKINIANDDADEEIPLINGLIQRLSPVANKFVDILFYNNILRLFYSFKRREFLLKKQIDTFSTYIAKNPGIDHMAGVPKGGTFILVYVNEERNEVFADFALPYLCCGKSNCIPMCDEIFELEIEPFARPDYAITLVDIPVEIDLSRNDSNIVGGNFEIKPAEASQFGGKIQQENETGFVTFFPAEGFVGTDTFTYTLTDTKTGKTDDGNVTVVIKSPEQHGCYTVGILQCWGDKSVMATLNGREINVPEDANIFELLLESLRKTGGFTEDEIFSSVLEEPETRRALLNCLGIANNDNTTYEELGQLILDYQNANCGSVQPSTECYTLEILRCWGDEAVSDTLNQRDLGVPTGSNMFEAVLADLRRTRGFTIDEIRFNVLESEERRRALLNCIGIQIGPNTTYPEMEQMILDYQNANCGTVQPTTECYTLEILGCWGDAAVKETIERRGLSVSAAENMFEVLLADLRRTGGFTQNEISFNVLESADRRRNLLKCLGISVNDTTPYDQLGQLIINYQLQNCGAVVSRPGVLVEFGLLAENDLRKVLEARGRNVASTESRTNLEKEIVNSGGNVLTETELMTVSKDSLTNILNKRNITFTTSDNKTQLIKKLLG